MHDSPLTTAAVKAAGSMMVRVKRRLRTLAEQLGPILLDARRLPERLDWTALFCERGPIEIEVGPGKGSFLLTAAEANPGVNYVGIEVGRKAAHYCAERLAQRGLKNVCVISGDARQVLAAAPADSVRAVHVYFPDPWWKRRHRKRRLFAPEFVAQVARVLQAGGTLEVRTDVPEYFKAICAAVGANAQLVREFPGDEQRGSAGAVVAPAGPDAALARGSISPHPGPPPRGGGELSRGPISLGSSFELKALKRGMRVEGARWRKPAGENPCRPAG